MITFKYPIAYDNPKCPYCESHILTDQDLIKVFGKAQYFKMKNIKPKDFEIEKIPSETSKCDFCLKEPFAKNSNKCGHLSCDKCNMKILSGNSVSCQTCKWNNEPSKY